MLLLRPLLATTLSAGLFPSLVATQVNPFVFYPQDPERQTVTCTSFVGRPDWNNAAEALIEIGDQDFRGLGLSPLANLAGYFGIYHWVADEKLSTSETYDLVIRSGATAGGPDMTPSGLIFRIAALTTPPSGNTQRGTWIMYDGFNIAGGVGVPYGMLHYIGVGLPQNPLWPTTDGHSLFRADLLHANTGATLGENHRAGAPNPTWAGRATLPSFTTPWTYILGPFVTTPNLHVGGIDPTSNRLGAPGANLGMNGLHPDVGGNPRSDGLMIRITDNLAPFGWVFLSASLGFQAPYYHPFQSAFTLLGFSHIGNAGSPTPIPLRIGTLQNGVREFSLATPGTIPPALAGSHLAFQAVVFDANMSLAAWTNAQAVHF